MIFMWYVEMDILLKSIKIKLYNLSPACIMASIQTENGVATMANRIVNYVVTYGVTSRHLCESMGVFERLKDARKAYNDLELVGNYKAKRLVRLSYPNKWSVCNDVRILAEVVA